MKSILTLIIVNKVYLKNHEEIELIRDSSLIVSKTLGMLASKIITHDILSKIFNFKVDKTKVGTPSFFYSIINKKSNKDILKEKIFYGKLAKYFNPKKTWEICNRQLKEKNDHIFLWRIFILSKIFEQD